MAAQLRQFSVLSYLAEAYGSGHDDFLFTLFHVIDENDVFYYGKLKEPKLQISLERFESALQRVPDEEIYAEFALHASYTIAPNDVDTSSTHYLKRPRLEVYSDYKEQDVLHMFPQVMLDEARALELISQHRHPNVVKYHGCRV
jgi:hypothetical protein